MVAAYIFDLDGTLFDSTEANIKSYSQAFKECGLQLPEEKYRQLFGLRYSEMIEQIAPHISEQTRTEIKRLKQQHYQENLDLVRPNEGLLALLASARENVKTALVTTASKQNVFNLLAHFSVDTNLFDIIITGEDVQNGKPDPECYLKAINILQLQPTECCIFEDSEVGVEAAVRSGAKVVKVSI